MRHYRQVQMQLGKVLFASTAFILGSCTDTITTDFATCEMRAIEVYPNIVGDETAFNNRSDFIYVCMKSKLYTIADNCLGHGHAKQTLQSCYKKRSLWD